ncbi:MAG: orotate phosphoribosyltransferase [Spirochaetaceae bacterium]|jgi:orotate phosphoribosyltransferase|nr:orotate phosphoribosyltransferase [Spirochaetaceae bacterium]
MSGADLAVDFVMHLLRETEAVQEGHFLLSSGRHSNRYVQCARLLQFPDKAAAALKPVADAIRADMRAGKLALDVVVGPAMGGIIVAYELGRQLGIPALFTERDDAGKMTFRRGFAVSEGQRVLIAEDVVTTGKSSGETAAVLEALGAKVAALACVVDRRAYAEEAAPQLPRWPMYPAVRVEAANWDAADCDLCKKGIPPVKPGSRKVF